MSRGVLNYIRGQCIDQVLESAMSPGVCIGIHGIMGCGMAIVDSTGLKALFYSSKQLMIFYEILVDAPQSIGMQYMNMTICGYFQGAAKEYMLVDDKGTTVWISQSELDAAEKAGMSIYYIIYYIIKAKEFRDVEEDSPEVYSSQDAAKRDPSRDSKSCTGRNVRITRATANNDDESNITKSTNSYGQGKEAVKKKRGRPPGSGGARGRGEAVKKTRGRPPGGGGARGRGEAVKKTRGRPPGGGGARGRGQRGRGRG